MAVINPGMTAQMNPHKLLGRRFEGQHAEANNITPNVGDEFWAWDTGYVLRENSGQWEVWFRTLPVERAMPYTDTFLTESF
jgi:hypothetical protein